MKRIDMVKLRSTSKRIALTEVQTMLNSRTANFPLPAVLVWLRSIPLITLNSVRNKSRTCERKYVRKKPGVFLNAPKERRKCLGWRWHPKVTMMTRIQNAPRKCCSMATSHLFCTYPRFLNLRSLLFSSNIDKYKNGIVILRYLSVRAGCRTNRNAMHRARLPPLSLDSVNYH